jgi:hypothetical protein
MAFASPPLQPRGRRKETDTGPNTGHDQPDTPKYDPITVRHTVSL